jgi:hypothetical protein
LAESQLTTIIIAKASTTRMRYGVVLRRSCIKFMILTIVTEKSGEIQGSPRASCALAGLRAARPSGGQDALRAGRAAALSRVELLPSFPARTIMKQTVH